MKSTPLRFQSFRLEIKLIPWALDAPEQKIARPQLKNQL